MNKRLGVNSKCKTMSYVTLCIPVSIYRLTLAWISSKTSTKQLECRLILTWSSSLSLDPISCWLASLLRCPVSTASVRGPSPTPLELLFPTLFSHPVTTSGHGEISSPKPFVWFCTKTDKGIVCLAGHQHSVTMVRSIWDKKKDFIPFYGNSGCFFICLFSDLLMYQRCSPKGSWRKSTGEDILHISVERKDHVENLHVRWRWPVTTITNGWVACWMHSLSASEIISTCKVKLASWKAQIVLLRVI